MLTNKKAKYNLFYNMISVNNKKGESLMEMPDFAIGFFLAPAFGDLETGDGLIVGQNSVKFHLGYFPRFVLICAIKIWISVSC